MAEIARKESVPGAMLVCLGLVLALGAVSALHGRDLADFFLRLAALLCQGLGVMSPKYAQAALTLQAMEPGSRDLSFAWSALNAAAFWYAVLLGVPAVLLLILRGWNKSPASVYRRVLDMQGLLKENAAFSPCVSPALTWPGGLLNEPLDSGPWRAARQSLQIAADKGLLVDASVPPRPVPENELLGENHMPLEDSRWLGLYQGGLALDRERAFAFYAAQLKNRWQGWDKLPPHLRKLSGAWILFAAEEKKLAGRLLDEPSLSFRGPVKARKACWSRTFPFYHRTCPARGWRLNTRLDKETVRKIRAALQSPGLQKALAPHQIWRDTALLAIYEKARERGVLPTAEFIWLRPLERQLYYLCNNAGRRTAWPEIAGAWAHYQAEKAAAALDPKNHGLEDKAVEEAVNALEAALYEEGWISPDRLSEKAARLSQEL